jgi:hypothetical protein
MSTTSLSRLLEDKMFKESMNRSLSFPKIETMPVLKTKPHRDENAPVDFGAVGTAYDYCLRLALIRTHELSHNELESFVGIKYYKKWYKTEPNLRSRMERHLSIIVDYLMFNLSNATSLFEASLFLAKFDSEYRSGRPISDLEIKHQDVAEVARVIEGSDLEWTSGEKVLLGPVFSRSGSESTIKADGDLIVGTTLVDVKTSGHMQLRENFRQLLGYYILNKLPKTPALIIDRIGVYYPRFDFFLSLPISEFLSESQEQILTSLFSNRLGDNIGINSSSL